MAIPINTIAPLISGNQLIGSALTCSEGTWTDTLRESYSFQWYRDGLFMSGEVSSIYTTSSLDTGHILTCEVTCTNLTNESSSVLVNILGYNTIAPQLTEDNDTNLITIDPTENIEVNVKGGGWNDTASPYLVTYETESRYEIGEIEFRVKAEGVNPPSEITANSIAFTECDTVDYTEVVYCSNDLGGVDTTTITVKLWSKIVQYKNNVVIRSEELKFTPDSETGKVVMLLPDTDSMVGKHEYRFDFGNNAWYFARVPKSTTPITFWDLNPTKNEG